MADKGLQMPDRLSEILEELLKSKYSFTDPRVKAKKLTVARQAVIELVAEEKYGYSFDKKGFNQGWNAHREATLKNMGEE